MRLNFNPNACAGAAIASHLNSSISSGIDLCIVAQDAEGITFAAWRFGNPLPKACTLTQRRADGNSTCLGSYLKKDVVEAYGELQGTKCFIQLGGTFAQRTFKLILSTAAKRMANKDVSLISFDPQYSE